MSDEEEESMSEGFSASEDDWKPENTRGGESSDDDDSDFEEVVAATGSAKATEVAANKKRETKQPSGIKGDSIKKRKPMGQSLRSKLYNKYRPPPKTFPTSSPTNSPSASSSNRLTASKNVKTPNESGAAAAADDSNASDSSVDDYLVHPDNIDFQSSFFTATAPKTQQQQKEKSPAPNFDCNAGLGNLSDSGSEDDNESSIDDNAKSKAFDFRSLLENANSLERAKETLAKRANDKIDVDKKDASNTSALDVNALLALGENQNYANTHDDGPSKLSKTKSTRVKRHTKTRPASTVVAGGDTDDSDWEEVAVADQSTIYEKERQPDGNLEIHVDLPTRQQRTKQQKTQDELELAFKRQINRDMKNRYILLHKVTFLCLIARSYLYNRISNDNTLMQAALKLLPSNNVYPTERGTELKYFQSFITWFKTAVKLKSPNLYPDKCAKTKSGLIAELRDLIRRKEARCKQDMILIFVILARAMGMHCRLIVNLQPLPLRPSAGDLIPIKLKKDGTEQLVKDEKQQPKQVETAAKICCKNDSKQSGVQIDANKQEVVKKTGIIKSAKSKEESVENKNLSLNASQKSTNAKAKMKSENKAQHETKKKQKLNNEVSIEEKVTKVKQKAENISKISPQEQSEIPKIDLLEIAEKPNTSTRSRRIAKNHEQSTATKSKPKLQRLKRVQPSSREDFSHSEDDELKKLKLERQLSLNIKEEDAAVAVARRTRQQSNDLPKTTKIGETIVPHIVLPSSETTKLTENENTKPETRERSKSPKIRISPTFLKTKNTNEIGKSIEPAVITKPRGKSPKSTKLNISPQFLKAGGSVEVNRKTTRVLRTRQQKSAAVNDSNDTNKLNIPQLDGAEDEGTKVLAATSKKRPKLEKLKKSRETKEESDEDFEPSPTKRTKKAPIFPKAVQQLRKDRRVLSTDDEVADDGKSKRKATASDWWIEMWSDIEDKWICVDLFKGKLDCVDTIRKAASSSLAYVFAFQNDLSLKDVTARYCPHWTTTVRKSRVEKSWIDSSIAKYLGRRTTRDLHEDLELRRIHEDKPMPTTISDYKDHPLYALERHLLKFQAIYPPDAPTLGFVRGEAVYARECVHLLHSREIWLKSARVVKLGEQPYKIVKARPKWDKLTQTVIKDQPLEIFGYWQTEDYDPPTAENGIVPRNAYGNVELFKACMLPKKTAHLRLPGLNRICKKLNIDCANAVIGFDFHQGACHPTFDGFVICEEFVDQVTAAWYQDQEEQDRKEQEKYEARVYGNWKKLIKGLLIRERLKKKYNF